jgi:hypothetical protein
MQRRLGYRAVAPGTPERHFPSLVRADALPVEIHHRVRDGGSELEALLWSGARQVTLGSGQLHLPQRTPLLIHTLDHGTVVHRALLFRLRDVLDTAALMDDSVDRLVLDTFIAAHSQERAVRTLLDAAAGLTHHETWMTDASARQRAWRRIHRVGMLRLFAPARADVPPTADPRVLVLSQLAGGSPATAMRLVGRAVRWPRRALHLVSGTWLPVEAGAAQGEPSPAPPSPSLGGGHS